MPNKKQRMQNANNHRKLMRELPPKNRCPNCLVFTHDGHFVPPSFGEEGFYICKRLTLSDASPSSGIEK